MITLLRLILAIAGLAITRIDPTEPQRLAAATYSVLIVYVLYSICLHLAAFRRIEFPVVFQHLVHWIDVAFYVTLIGLSSGTNSIFFVYFFFCILVASFRWGFASGLEVTVVSVVLFVAVGHAARPPAPEYDLDRFILRASALPVLGYMIAHWGGHELRLKRRLSLLKEISALSNPRFGVDRTLGANMERLRVFCGADYCLAVQFESEEGPFLLRRAAAGDPDGAMGTEVIPAELARTLLSFGPDEAVCFSVKRGWSQARRMHRDPQVGAAESKVRATEESCRAVAEVLGASAFLTVPMRSRSRSAGRLFLTSRVRSFREGNLEFLQQAVDQIMPVLDNIVLVDRMATRAAEDERQRIARDIHDRIIQPYVGLQLGITSVHQFLDRPPADNFLPLLRERAAKLQALAAAGIADLRNYVHRLKYGEGAADGLVEGLRRFAERFSEATGIRVEVHAADGFRPNDRLAAEVFPMLTEALSNIRRHTQALRCSIELKTTAECLVAVVVNETGAEGPPAPFVPRSIAERAAALQGTVRVQTPDNGATSVVIEIPL